MIRQFNDLSSWRTDTVVLPGGEVTTLDFLDTKPNMFVISNPNDATLKVSIGSVPRDDSYEFYVSKNTNRILGRPTPTGKIYILNTSGVEVTVLVFSIFDEFDINILNEANVSIEGANVSTDGIVKGFKSGVSIPSGTNTIGKVEMGAGAETLLNSILSKLGAVQLSTTDHSVINDIKTLISNFVKESSVGGMITIGNLYGRMDYINKTLLSKSLNASDIQYKNNISSFSYTASKKCVINFEWIFNDSGETVHLCKNGTPILDILKDEKFADLDVELNTNDVVSITGTNISMRMKYCIY